jgi:O-antigen/teichoic acid export membrane protein
MINWRGSNKRQAVILTGAETVGRLLTFAVVVVLINYLGATAFGELSFAFAIANIVVLVADFGLSTYLVRQFAQARGGGPDIKVFSVKQRQQLGQIFVCKSGLIILTIGLIVAAGLVLTNLSWITLLSGGAAIVFTNARMFLEALFRVQQHMSREAVTKIGHALVLAVLLVWGINQGFTVEQFAITYGVVAVLATIGAAVLLARLPLQPQWHGWQSQYWQTMVVGAWPFAASFGINALFNYLDSAMLGWLGQLEATGWYNAAYKPIFFLTAIAGMIINAYLPTIALTYQTHSTGAALNGKVQELLNLTMVLAWPMMIGGWLVADRIFALLFEPTFAPAIPSFQILLASTVCIYAWAVFGNSLQVCGREKVYLRNFALALIVTVVGNVLLIPRFSLYGAALATLCTQLTLVVLMYRDWKKLGRIYLWSALQPPLIGSAAMAGVIWLCGDLSIWLIVPLAAIVYGMVVVVIKQIQKL